jgi:hypothetical protein
MQYPPAAQPTAPAAVAASPSHVYWYGSTEAEVLAQDAAINAAAAHPHTATAPGYAVYAGAAQPTQAVPYEPSGESDVWCRELDGSYTLRSWTECMKDLQPGHWVTGVAGYPYFVREKKPE